MPRMENTGPEVDKWYAENDEGTSNFDLCRGCADAMEGEPTPKGWCYAGDPAGVLSEYDSGPYDDDVYECQKCGKRLTEAADS